MSTKKTARKTKVPKKPRASRVPKTRNANTMTESGFWTFIRAALRSKSRWWKPVLQVKQAAKRTYTAGKNKRQKYEYQCNICKGWFADKEVEVDHIIPAGTLKCAEDLPGFVERLFVEAEGLQVVCHACHDIKTLKDVTNMAESKCA